MRSQLYHLARILGDVSAISKGPTAIIKRLIRKFVWRTFGKFKI